MINKLRKNCEIPALLTNAWKYWSPHPRFSSRIMTQSAGNRFFPLAGWQQDTTHCTSLFTQLHFTEQWPQEPWTHYITSLFIRDHAIFTHVYKANSPFSPLIGYHSIALHTLSLLLWEHFTFYTKPRHFHSHLSELLPCTSILSLNWISPECTLCTFASSIRAFQ